MTYTESVLSRDVFALTNIPARLSPVYVVDGQPIHVASLRETCRVILDRIRPDRSFFVCTLNLDHLVKLREDSAFRRVYSEAEIVTADGYPIVFLAGLDRVPIERVTGVDLVAALCAAAALRDFSIFIVGPDAEANTRCARRLQADIPTLRIGGAAVAPLKFDPTGEDAIALVETIRRSGAKLCFVGLGAPKQETFAALVTRCVPGAAFIPVGAAIEYIAGTKRRAPHSFQRAGIEWTWRLMAEPRRLAGRYARGASLFLGLLLRRRKRPRG
jgi:exopolysaccharide biosynthesis WecB/TagA/CpsF family protein